MLVRRPGMRGPRVWAALRRGASRHGESPAGVGPRARSHAYDSPTPITMAVSRTAIAEP